MKKAAVFLILASFIATSALFSSCVSAEPGAGTPPEAAGADETSAVPAAAGTSAAVPEASPGFEFKDVQYDNGGISVKYPQIVNEADAEKQDALNKLIADAALRDIDMLKNDAGDTDYEIVYEVTYNSPELISMVFSGYSSSSYAAHPSQFLYTVTLDTAKLEKVTLPFLVRISEDFIGVLTSGEYSAEGYDMTEEYAASIKEYLTGMDTEFWLGELQNADTPGYATASYLTKDALVVSVSVPHVMGDHIEIVLKFKDLSGYQTDNPIWKALEG